MHEFLVDPDLGPRETAIVTDALASAVEAMALSDSVNCVMFMLWPDVRREPFERRGYSTVVLDPVSGLATEDTRSWLLYWRPFSTFIDERLGRPIKALRYHSRRPRGKTQELRPRRRVTLPPIWPWPIRQRCHTVPRDPAPSGFGLPLHQQRQSRRDRVERHCGARIGKSGTSGCQARDGGKVASVQTIGGHRRVRFELDVVHPEELVRVVTAMAPTFGGMNLEDIKAPEWFEIEEALRDVLSIPVFHDDQHGTAIVVGAALLNGLEIQRKVLGNVRVVIAGAGAAGIACAAMVSALGVGRDQIVLVDSRGVVHTARTDLNPYKRRFATRSADRTLADALRGADVFIGVSGPGTVTADMLCSMADRPLIFALANPEPEVSHDVVARARPDAVFASGGWEIQTKSTTCSRSHQSFAGRSMCARRASTNR